MAEQFARRGCLLLISWVAAMVAIQITLDHFYGSGGIWCFVGGIVFSKIWDGFERRYNPTPTKDQTNEQ